jgi:hypothetical protein
MSAMTVPDAVRREVVAGLGGVVGVERLADGVGEVITARLVDVDRHLAHMALKAGVAVGLGGEDRGCRREQSDSERCEQLGHRRSPLFWAPSRM